MTGAGPGREARAVIAVLLGSAVLASTGCRAANDPWNVLVLVPDTVRADHLSVNGYPRETSPHIDALAREGTNFTQAVTVAPRTWQSFSSILTGLTPPRHGVRYMFDHPLRPDTPHLGSLLGRSGYTTAATGALKGLTGGVGFGSYLVADLARVRASGQEAEQTLTEQIFEWMSQAEPTPFLAFVQFLGGHWPYVHPAWVEPFESCDGHDHGFNRGAYGFEIGKSGEGFVLKDAEANRETMWSADFDAETLHHMVAHYDAEIRGVDALIGGLIDRMRDSGLLEKTIVVVTSDHGESFGEHGYLQHGPRVDDPVMRVPLVIRLPGGHPSSNPGGVVDQLVRTVDILPTLLDAVGVPAPQNLDGISLLPAIEGERLPELWAYGESGRSFTGTDPERHFPGVEGKHRMIRTNDWKLVFVPDPDGGVYRLYDLRADPGEMDDVAAAASGVLAGLRAHLQPILAAEEPAPAERMLTPEDEDQLRKLGYLD
jgi:arylsulfatase A-like enzyme